MDRQQFCQRLGSSRRWLFCFGICDSGLFPVLGYAEIDCDGGGNLIHEGGGGCFDAGDVVGVDVEGDGYFGVAQDAGDFGDGDVVLEHLGGGGVAQVVEFDVGQAGGAGEVVKFFGDVVAVLWFASVGWKDQVIFFPGVAFAKLGFLAGEISQVDLAAQGVEDARAYFDGTPA